ncbi:uncharacterized protein JCM15063_001988 [Sporobolomyces koalae]|uniref:uncharacterized protein n=1 Tax=Sporobolomyces koalae TaxID=500713 RepID=UPI00317ECF91
MKPNLTASATSGTSSSRSPTASGLLPATSSTAASPLISSTTPPASEEPSPTDLLLATPPTLLKLFALAAPFVSLATTFCQLVTWQHPNFFASLLVLLAWWAVCLFGRWIAQYGFNLAVLVYIGSRYFSTAPKQASHKALPSSAAMSSSSATTSSYRHSRPPTLTPAAYSNLLTSSHFLLSHLQAFRAHVVHPLSLLFSFTPTRPSVPAPAYSTARLALTSYPFYLILTYLVPLRYIFLVLGSTAILWNAPFFKTLRTLLWTSATIRWFVRISSSILLNGGTGFNREWNRTKSGVGIAGLLGKKDYANQANTNRQAVVEEKVVKRSASISTTSRNSQVEPIETSDVVENQDEEDVEVQFTVFENQRWWVGLDWTHALLPGERASWTDPASHPSNPPASFNLPPPQITYIPSPTSTDPGSRLRKTTSWRWVDPEWKVLRESIPSVLLPAPVPSVSSPVLSGGDSSSSTLSGSPPSPSTATSIFSSLPSPPANLLPVSTTTNPVTPTAFARPTMLVSDAHSKLFEHWQVDAEGWQYGDNHFDKMGPKGGLSKYTRRRAWVRRAGLVEKTERFGSDLDKEERGRKKDSTSMNPSGGVEGQSIKDKSRRKSESRSGIDSNRRDKTTFSTTATGTGTSTTQVKKRKSMPPSLDSQQSISRDVD